MQSPRLSARTLALVSLCAATAVVAMSCQKAPDTSLGPLSPTDSAIVGSYDLFAVNGLPLPSTTQVNATQAIEVDGERIVIAADNTWADTATTVVIDLVSGNNSLPTLTASAGTLNIVNGTINFVTTVGGGAAFTGSVKGDTLTVQFTGTRFVYVK